MTDQLINQQEYERESAKNESYKAWQCALMVIAALCVPSGIVFYFS
jgi:hypothetical protein